MAGIGANLSLAYQKCRGKKKKLLRIVAVTPRAGVEPATLESQRYNQWLHLSNALTTELPEGYYQRGTYRYDGVMNEVILSGLGVWHA